jgi:hypothetical protein
MPVHEADHQHVVAVDPSSRRVWRVRTAGRVGALAATLLWVGVATLITAGGKTPGLPFLLWPCAALIALGVWRGAFVPSITLTSDGVVIQNPITRVAVPYAKISHVHPGYYGVRINRLDGPTVTAWAVQKTNAAKWSGAGTRADEVSQAILAHVPTANQNAG